MGEGMSAARASGEMAIAMANLARESIGPNGTVIRVGEDDAPMVRSAFIARLSEAALKILDEEAPGDH